MSTKEMKTLTIGDVTYEIVDNEAVHYSAQSLTEEQKAQVKTNIGVYVQSEEPTDAVDGDIWVDADAEAHLDPEIVIDSTLTKSGQAADAKAVGERIDYLCVEAGITLPEPADDDIPKVFIDGNIPTTKDDVLAEMEYVSKTSSFHAYLKIKCQGSSSMAYPKKNFTIKMYSDEDRSNKLEKIFKDWEVASHKYVLKANYIDHTHARNIVSARLWNQTVSLRSDYDSLPEEMRNSPRNGAIDGFPIKVYINGTYQGVYTWNIGKDDWMWGMDENNPNHVLLCAETNTGEPNPCNFTALWDGVHEHDWSVEVGTNSDAVKTSLNNLIACVMDTDDETFKSAIDEYLDVQSAIDYIIHMSTILAPDNVARNLLLATYDGVKWYCGAYDMDATFGSDAIGGALDASGYWPWNDSEHIGLWHRIKNTFKAELAQRYCELRKTVYSKSNMVSQFEYMTNLISDDLYSEDMTFYPDIPNVVGNIAAVRNFIRDREWCADYDLEGCKVRPSEGSRTFTDGYAVSVDGRGRVAVTVDNPYASFVNINISDVNRNSDVSTGDNGCFYGCPEIFKLYKGDKVRLIVKTDAESNPTFVFKLGAASGESNPIGAIEIYQDYWDETGAKYVDVTYVMEHDLSVGCVFLQPSKTTSFQYKIYVNGVRYV